MDYKIIEPIIVQAKHMAEVEKLKTQLDIVNNFYYGDDLNDKDIMRFYSEIHSELTNEIEEQLKKLESET